LDLAPWVGESAAFHGEKEFIASFVCTGVRTLEDVVLGFEMELAARTEMSVDCCGTNMFLLGTSVEPAMETFRARDPFDRVQ
jgi:hypothetical protein